MKITDFLNNDLVDYASYDNLRSIASYVDGLKNTSRKVLYTILKKNIKEEIKVSQLSSKMAEFTQYMHGDASGVIVSMAQNFTGTNNMPIIAAEGNFGTRFKNEASAPRYIYTMKNKNTDYLFKKDDEPILVEQIFEGDVIEPRYYIPTIPLILINGSTNCITPGFKQHILPRKKEDVIEYIKCRLNGEDVSHIELIPHYNGFNGTVVNYDKHNNWMFLGKFEKVGRIGLRVTELTPNWDLKKYNKLLKELVENKVIKSYKDKSEGDSFIFEIQTDPKFLEQSDEKILNILKLVKKESEQYNCIDENNKMRLFSDVFEILDTFIEFKKKLMVSRKKYVLDELKEKMNFEASRYLFIKHINDGDIIINKKTKQEIIDQLKVNERIIPKDGNFDYLMNISIYRLTIEEMDKSKNNILEMKNKYKEINETPIESLWMSEII